VIVAAHRAANVSGAAQSALVLPASALTHNPIPRSVAICRLPPFASANCSMGLDWQCLLRALADAAPAPALGMQSRGYTV